MKLYAPKEYWNAAQEEREANCNGCGSELDLSGKLVPDTMWGLNIIIACCIHDWMYTFGLTKADRLFSDSIFLLNLCLIIINKGGWLMVPRLFRATKYFVAVVKAGNGSFFHQKKVNNTMEITFHGTFEEIK